MTDIVEHPHVTEQIDHIVIRFAGDSGDGMQLTGDRFTSASALFGNDLSTFPDYPAEIRAPAGTVNGVSSFQVHISDHDITTPGDAPGVLVAMNPAALKADLGRLTPGGTLILNVDTFDERNLAKADFASNPLEDDSLSGYRVIKVPMTEPTKAAAAPLGVKPRYADRSKNFFALGLVSFMYSRPIEPTLQWIDDKYGKNDLVRQSNRAADLAGYHYGETTEEFGHRYEVKPADLPPGEYTNINGNMALAWGSWPLPSWRSCRSRSARTRSRRPVTSSTSCRSTRTSVCAPCRPRTRSLPLHWRSAWSFAGHLGITTTSGPGVALKSEATSLAVSLEVPFILIDIQRGGPSTGLPTKTEAADLNIAMFGRHGEAPLPIIASYSPSHCFFAAIEAARIALKYRTPVILLSDGYLANGTEPWRLPDPDDLPDISVPFATEFNHVDADGNPEFYPYLRDPETLARPWAIPGTPGLMHRVGGIEKEDGSGNINYSPANHDKMVHLRAAKVAGIANDIPLAEVHGDADADVCILGWGSTWAAIDAAVQRTRRVGTKVAWIHLMHLNPMPLNLGELLHGFRRVIVPELNMGQLCRLVRADYLVDARPVTKVQGLPFTAHEIEQAIQSAVEELS